MEGQIPVIDLQKIQKESHLLREACKLWGCFRLINHGLPFKLIAEMKSTMKALFDRPVEIKRRIKGEIEISGFRPPSKLNPLYECFSIYDASPEAVSSFCTDLQLTPQQSPYNFENWLVEIRPNKYSFTPESIGSHGAIIHTDDGFLTILQDDESIGGLEVMDPSGSFVSVDPALGTFLVNLGDVATGWSNGELRNVQHRVQCKEAGMRLSIAVFLEPPKDTIIEPHPQFIKPNQPLRISPFTHKQLRNTRVAKNLHVGEALYLVRT
ncbi:hypothetical protein RND81_04G052900 [Saponaria officinalis]|uniref:Fe2OG dioxygenase domain-containing protein n=1 Tax=Saponaria officinalis TaxID=3572 RepID=A0AAW1LI66_SAPOF